MSLSKVQACLIATLKGAFDATWPGKIQWENVSFTPPQGSEWMSVHFMPADENADTLGDHGSDRNDGLFQITLHYPVGVGEGTSRQTIDQLRTCFRPRTLLHEGQSVTILSRSRGSAKTGNFYAIPFTVRWKANIQRSL